jgi:ABC-type dipeptide/oligopeptide/nickel transport system permease component
MKEEKQHIMGVFTDEEPLVEAFRDLQKQEVEISDVFTPFPVHEILEHHGRKSRIITLSWFFGLFAALGVLSFLIYTAVIDWPLNYGGKPSSAFPSFIVVTIILTIFSVTILSLFTFSIRAKLWPNVDKPIYHEEATDDKFVILFEKEKIDESKVKKLLKDHGAIDIIEK